MRDEAKDAEIEELKAKLAEAEKGLEDHKRICNQHMKNIRTWMPEGFQSHCTDAMIIMADKRDEAQAACAKCGDALEEVHRKAHEMCESVGGLAAHYGDFATIRLRARRALSVLGKS